MDIMDFLGLDEARYWDVFDKRAELIYKYETIDAAFELYALDSFYVELTFAPDSALLQAVNPFKHGPRLEKCLDEFDFEPID